MAPTAETITLSWHPTGVHPPDGKPVISPADLTLPQRLGPVKLIRQIGHGGMGVVWLARHEFLERDVAVKFLLAAVADRDDPRFVTFLDGARAAARVRHLGLTAVLHADLHDKLPYMVMEFVNGPTAGELLDRCGPLPVAAVLAILERVADALGSLHDGGVIHRDIKPTNILIDDSGHAFLTDFGLAFRADAIVPPTPAGTPACMAPEAFRGETTPKSDVYSLAATAFQLLSGKPAFEGSLAAIRKAQEAGPPDPQPLLHRGLSPLLVDVLQRSMHPSPQFRAKSATKLLESYREVAGPCGAAGTSLLATLAESALANPGTTPLTLPSTTRAAASSSTQSPTPQATYFQTLTTLADRKRQSDSDAAPKAPPAAPEPPAGPALTAILQRSLPCVSCRYDLKGLAVGTTCPECRTPVADSLSGSRLLFEDPDWIGEVRSGLLLISVSLLTHAAVFLAALAIHDAGANRLSTALVASCTCLIFTTLVALGAWTASRRWPVARVSALTITACTVLGSLWVIAVHLQDRTIRPEISASTGVLSISYSLLLLWLASGFLSRLLRPLAAAEPSRALSLARVAGRALPGVGALVGFACCLPLIRGEPVFWARVLATSLVLLAIPGAVMLLCIRAGYGQAQRSLVGREDLFTPLRARP